MQGPTMSGWALFSHWYGRDSQPRGHEHTWEHTETELGGRWANPGAEHYECACGAYKYVAPDGLVTITEADGREHPE